MPESRADDDVDEGSQSRPSDTVFPLRLTAFENYMFVDDRRSHPMTFVIEVEVSGDLRMEPLTAAIITSLERHPLLRARVTRRLNGRCWVPVNLPPAIEVIPQTDNLRITPPPMDLRRVSGCQIWILPSADGGKILFNFHHAATDGLGAMQFIGDVLVDYARRTALPGQELPEPRSIDVSALKNRGRLDNPGGTVGHTPWSRAGVFFRQLGQSASRLAVPGRSNRTQGDSLHGLPPFVSRTMDREFVLTLKQAAARRMLHLNDLYVAGLFKSVYDWNRRHGEEDDQRLIRLSLPTSLRTPLHDLCPAANVVNMVFVNRLESDCGDLNSLLERAGEAMNASTHDRVFFRAMQWARWMPGVMEAGSRLPYSFATMVITNVGDVKRQFGTRFPLKRGRCVAGAITLEALRGTAPLRPGTHVGVSVGTYAGELFINVICDPHLYTRQNAEEFLTLFIAQLEELTATHSLRRAA